MANIIKIFFAPYLNWSYVDKALKVRVRVIERPAYSLEPKELDELREHLKAIVKKSIPKEDLNYGIFSENSDAYKLNPIWISNVTQVPAIVGMASQSFERVYPTPKNIGNPPFIHSWLVRQIMGENRHVFGVGPDAEFDSEKFIIKNSYTGGSDHLKKKFTEAQAHRDPIYNDFCKNNLDYDRGDDFIQIGQFNLMMTKKFMMKSAPKKSVMGILVSLFFITLQSVFAPILLWLDANKKYGELRPWKK